MNIIKIQDLKLLEQRLPLFPWYIEQYIQHKLVDLSPLLSWNILGTSKCYFIGLFKKTSPLPFLMIGSHCLIWKSFIY